MTAMHQLRDVLCDMGIPDAFDIDFADFGEMIVPNNSETDSGFCISQLIQKALIEVDEKGTRAAAATGSILSTGALAPPPRLVVNVNRPFLFTICGYSPIYRASTVYFMGRVMAPAAMRAD